MVLPTSWDHSLPHSFSQRLVWLTTCAHLLVVLAWVFITSPFTFKSDPTWTIHYIVTLVLARLALENGTVPSQEEDEGLADTPGGQVLVPPLADWETRTWYSTLLSLSIILWRRDHDNKCTPPQIAARRRGGQSCRAAARHRGAVILTVGLSFLLPAFFRPSILFSTLSFILFFFFSFWNHWITWAAWSRGLLLHARCPEAGRRGHSGQSHVLESCRLYRGVTSILFSLCWKRSSGIFGGYNGSSPGFVTIHWFW